MKLNIYSSNPIGIIKNRVSNELINRIDTLISSGGDRRLNKINNSLNKYFVSPISYKGVINRGSCTCSPFTPEAFFSTCNLLSSLTDINFEELKKQQTLQLKSLIDINNKNNFDVFYAPSGSDLCYFPLIFSQLLYPNKKICNLVTCPEELGSGSRLASEGKYYFDLNQYGKQTPIGEAINPSQEIEKIDFPARNRNGLINDHRHTLSEVIKTKLLDNYSIICNLVIGSKSGIEDNLDIIPKYNNDVLFVIDICQARVTSSLINYLLDLSCCVMITGSKFYQSPPFSGALLVPRTVVNKIQASNTKTLGNYEKVFTKHDFPESLEKIRNSFPDYKNHGLLLRWHASIYEMTQLSKLKNIQIYKVIKRWNDLIKTELSIYDDRFTIMPDTDKTNKTIISFRVKSKTNRYLNHEELWSIYEAISTDTHTDIDNYQKILIGQPVSYGERSFLRVALGSYEIRQLLKNNLDYSLDKRIIKIIYEKTGSLF